MTTTTTRTMTNEDNGCMCYKTIEVFFEECKDIGKSLEDEIDELDNKQIR